MTRDNYITIQGWMITELGLKGNDLLVYALIYGFSQAPGQSFVGSLSYLALWTGSTKQGVQKNLKRLSDMGLIEKSETTVDGVKTCSYRTNKKTAATIEEPKAVTTNPKKENAVLIINYLNNKLGTRYSADSRQTQTLISCRFKENKDLTVDDFYAVIDDRFARWSKDKKMSEYLRPSTLFSPKFEGYLEEARKKQKHCSERFGGNYL